MASHDRPSQPLPAEEPAEPVPARASATVIVARDGAEGLEVFMLERNLRSDFIGGAYVFPGGTIDDGDRDAAWADVVDGWSADLAKALGEHDEAWARALYVCAIRETFEEAGILLARLPDGSAVRLARAQRWFDLRRQLQAREVGALDAAREGGVRFAADLLRFWARWVTPTWAPRRYDTRFFIAMMPEGQEPLHDDVEVTNSVWVRPADAVARALAGDLSIIFPTRKMLESLARYPSADDLFEAAVGRPVEPVLPRIVMEDGEPRVVLPDGSLHAP